MSASRYRLHLSKQFPLNNEAGYLFGTAFGTGGQLALSPAIPTLSQWGMISMATLFAVALAWMARRRFVAKAGTEG